MLFRLLSWSRSLLGSCYCGGGGWSSTVQAEGQGRTHLNSLSKSTKPDFILIMFGRHSVDFIDNCVIELLWLKCVCFCCVQVFIFTLENTMLQIASEVSGREVNKDFHFTFHCIIIFNFFIFHSMQSCVFTLYVFV